MAVSGNSLFILRGGTVYRLNATSLAVETRADLPMTSTPPPAGGGNPVPPPDNGTPPPDNGTPPPDTPPTPPATPAPDDSGGQPKAF